MDGVRMADREEIIESAEDFETKILTLLPDQYQDTYESVRPVSMGSAALKFDSSGKVAWDQMWGSFCDLAMAGGPPHKGKLLEPDFEANILALPERYKEVTEEICRGIGLATGLSAAASGYPGWIGVECTSTAQAGWLARAITMENISIGLEGTMLYLPAGPHYRLKEIKNVVTVIAKTCHYWFGHIPHEQRRSITRLFEKLEISSPLMRPVFPRAEMAPVMEEALYDGLKESIYASTGLRCYPRAQSDWLGLQVHDLKPAIWLMRALVVSNVLARREDDVVFAAVNAIADPCGEALAERIRIAYQHGVAGNIFG
jgi:sirohydrochlorin cobaltochelatase